MLNFIFIKVTLPDGTVDIKSSTEPARQKISRVPVDAVAFDLDGVGIDIILHVVSGYPVMLEISKWDGSDIQKRPPPEAFTLRTYKA